MRKFWLPWIREKAPARKPSAISRYAVADPSAWIMMRGYDAAKSSPYLAGWNPDIGSTPESTARELPVVRNRARDLDNNEGIGTRALQLLCSNIIGPHGIRFACTLEDRELRKMIETAWVRWGKSKECDVEGRSTLVDLQTRIVRTWMRDGEALVEIIPGAKNSCGIALRLLDPCQLAHTLVKREGKGNRIFNGVEVDGFGKPVAYHFFKYTDARTGYFFGGNGGRPETVRVPASRIRHLYTIKHPGVYRGFSVFAPVCKPLRHVNAYREAELVAARAEAMRTGTWQAMESALDPSQVADKDEGGFQDVMQPGDTRIAPYGWEYRPDGSPAHPAGAFGTFTKTILQTIASGLNLSYPALASDLEGVSYSSIRAGTLADRDAYQVLQEAVVDTILRPIFAGPGGWLDCFALTHKDFPVSALEEARWSDRWTPRSWPWVDPTNDATAMEKQVSHHWKTDSEVTASLGGDWEKNVEQAAEEKKVLKKLGEEGETNGQD